MKTNMTIDEEILKGFTIQTVNPETGVVDWWSMPDGEKFSSLNVLQVLTDLGWEYGNLLFFHVNGSLADIYLSVPSCPLATISAKLADSFRKESYAVFFKEASECN